MSIKVAAQALLYNQPRTTNGISASVHRQGKDGKSRFVRDIVVPLVDYGSDFALEELQDLEPDRCDEAEPVATVEHGTGDEGGGHVAGVPKLLGQQREVAVRGQRGRGVVAQTVHRGGDAAEQRHVRR